MSTDPVVALLAKQPAIRLREMQSEIREQLQSLQAQADLIDRALAVKDHGVAQGRDQPADTRRAARGGNKRSVFREIMAAPHQGAWKATEIRSALLERGIDSTSASIRVMLSRMSDDGEVVRSPDGSGWKLASTNGSYQETLAEAPSVGPGGYEP